MSKRKAPSSDNPNNEFCEFLSELASYEKNVSRNIHKYNVYRKAASILAAQPNRIQSGAEARKLPGIGDKIGKKIDEYIQTGKLRKIETIQQDTDFTAISELTRVSGIGPAKAKELVSSGIKTIEDLQENKSKLNHHQLIGLQYIDDFEKPIPRDEIIEIEKKLKKVISSIDPQFDATICGSYRRGKSSSGDIDVLVSHPLHTKVELAKSEKGIFLKKIVSALQSENIITDTITHGENKFMGVCKLASDTTARRLDIKYTAIDEYYCAILYFTGSDVYNKTMRGHAQDKGFTLNDHCLRPLGTTGVPGEAVPITCEEDIFDYIDFPYKKPEDRNM